MPTEYDLAYRQYGTGLPYQNNPTSPQVKTISQSQPEPQPTPAPVVSIRGQVHTIRGRNYYRFTSTSLPNGMYAEGDWIMDDPSVEGNYERAVQNTATFLGINRWDIAGQEKTAPAGIDLGATQRRLSTADAITKAQEANVRSQQDFMKSNWGGRPMTPSARVVVDAPIGANIKQYEQAVPIERKQIAMKRGMLENTKTWASTKAYEDAYAQVSRSTKVIPQKEINIDNPSIRETQAKEWMATEIAKGGWVADSVKPTKNEYGEFIGMEGIQIPTQPKPESNIYVERFGKMVPKKETGIYGVQEIHDSIGIGSGVGETESMSTYPIYKKAKEAKDWLYNVATDIEEHKDTSMFPTPFSIVPTATRSVGNIIEFGGMIPAGSERLARLTIKKGASPFVMAAASGLVLQAEGISEQAQKDPLQLVSDVAITAGVIKGVGVVGRPVVSAGRTAVSTVKNIRPRIVQTTEPLAVPGMGVTFRPKYSLELAKRRASTSQVLESPTKGEFIMGEQKGAINFYNRGVLKTTAISKDAPLIDLTQEPIMNKPYTASEINIAHKQSGKYQVRSGKSQATITHVLERTKSQELLSARKTPKVTTPISEPTFAEYSVIIAAQTAGQIQRTRQIAGQLTGQQTKQVQSTQQVTGQLTGLKSLNITAQTTKQKTDTEQIVSPVSIYKTPQVQTPIAIQIPIMDTVLTPKTTTRQTPRTVTTPTARTPTKPKTPTYPKILDESEDFLEGKDKKKKGIKKSKSAITSPDFWYPASYESVTKEELSLGGRRATHIGKQEKKKTSTLYSKKIVTRGKPIPTKRQFKASDLL